MYTVNVLRLWFTQKIDFRTLTFALRERPDAIAGKGGSYHVGPHDPNE